VQLALASVTNACWDLWAKTRGVPLWKLLLDLTPAEVVATLDLSYLEDVLTRRAGARCCSTAQRHPRLPRGHPATGYPGYDTSVGWFNYYDEQVRENCKRAIDAGFTAMKLKVGSKDPNATSAAPASSARSPAPEARVMVDANQQWTLPQALDICARLRKSTRSGSRNPPIRTTSLGHKTLADAIAPVKLALGEHVPNRVMFKNYLQAECAGFIQVDAVRVAGCQRVPRREPAVQKVRRARRPARRRHGPAPPAPRALQPHRPRPARRFPRTHPAPARALRASRCRVEGGVYHTPQDIGAGSGCDLL
jgi:L-fuconate dehydratase